MEKNKLAALIFGVALAGCTPSPQTYVATPQAASQAPAQRDTHELLNALLWVQTSAEFNILSSTAYRDAGARLRSLVQAAKSGKFSESAALEQPGHNEHRLPLAVVLDIDETVLDNSPMSGRLVKQRSAYTDATWSAWVEKESAAFLPGAEGFIKEARSLGVSVYFVTNRTKDEKLHTLRNLAAVAATGNEILASAETAPGEPAPWTDEKKGRREFIAKTHWIALLIGDDLGDFIPGIRVLPPGQRVDEAKKYVERFGTRWFLLPNPVYGSWESVLYNESDPDATQLHDKMDKVMSY